MIDEGAIRQRWEAIGSKLDERGRRLLAACEVLSAGWGGLALVSKITALARSTINRGEDDLDAEPLAKGRVRWAGGGRRAVSETDSGLVPALKRLVDPATLGGPMRPLTWVSKSMEKLAAALTEMGHPISADTVRKELVKLGFSRQSNRKAEEGSNHPDRNAQFDYINAKVLAAQARQQPVVSVDTKKKELIGNFKNGGTDYRPKGSPQRVNVHDFENKKLGKVVPYGVYDVTANTGFVSVGITSDTAEFAVQSIRCWRERMGEQRYPNARELTIMADCGGSNGARVRLWKLELQKLADETGLVIHVHHYPPGTSKWNKIEYRLFCHITQNWRGRPLTTRLAVIGLIGAATTKTGLKVARSVSRTVDRRFVRKRRRSSTARMMIGAETTPTTSSTFSATPSGRGCRDGGEGGSASRRRARRRSRRSGRRCEAGPFTNAATRCWMIWRGCSIRISEAGSTCVERGNLSPHGKGEIQAGGPCKDESTDAGHMGGAPVVVGKAL